MAEAPIHLAICLPALGHGGPDRAMIRLIHGFDPRRVRATVIVGSTEITSSGELPDHTAIVVAPGWPLRYPVGSVARAIRQISPDVVLATLRMIPTVLAARPLIGRVRVIVRPANNMVESGVE